MRIKDVKFQVFKRDLPVPADRLVVSGVSMEKIWTEGVLVRILTDEGIEGNGMNTGGRAMAEYLSNLKPALIGQDPLDREKIWQELWHLDRLMFLPQLALGSIDVALWDIGGKAAGLPIYKLLGAYRDKVRAYASSMGTPDVESCVQQALHYKNKGYTAYKIHAWGIADKDIEVCKAVREAVGHDIDLMLDAMGYSHEEALRVGRELEKLGFFWYEEPVLDYDIHGYKQLSRALDIPIVGTEVIPGSLYSAPEYIVTGAVDIIRGDVLFKGGITPVKKLAALAEAFGMNMEIHTNCNPLGNSAHMHVTCSIKNCEFYEVFVPEEYFSFGVKEDIRIDDEGYAHVPQKPGLGMEIDWNSIDKWTIATL